VDTPLLWRITAPPTSGAAPLAVSFTDTSTGSPTSCSWRLGDSSTSTAQHPSHTYVSAGYYPVTLTATNAGGLDGETKTNYLTVCTEVTLFPNAIAQFRLVRPRALRLARGRAHGQQSLPRHAELGHATRRATLLLRRFLRGGGRDICTHVPRLPPPSPGVAAIMGESKSATGE